MQMEKTSYLFTVCNQNFQKKGKKKKERKNEWKKKKAKQGWETQQDTICQKSLRTTKH